MEPLHWNATNPAREQARMHSRLKTARHSPPGRFLIKGKVVPRINLQKGSWEKPWSSLTWW
jgi:hypothetical protein